ncbi:MAG: hypothetical protein KBS84_03695 [Treponema sp.]|nr:hypothetical protein [Candidatus Treponema scatequi]
MPVLLIYAFLFFGSSFIGVGLLSWFQKFYLQGQPEKYLNGLPITVTVTFCLCTVILIITAFVLKPVDKLLKDIKKNGHVPTDEDRKLFLSCSKKMNTITLVSTVIGFVFGNLITMTIVMIKGIIPFEWPRIIFAIIHSCAYGGIATLYTINLMDFFMNDRRELLKIRKIEKEQMTGTMAGSFTYMFVVSIFAIATSVIMVPYQLIYTADKGQMWQGFNFYIGQSIFVFLVVFVSCAIPFIMIVQGTTKRLKRNSQLLHNIAESGDLVSRIDIVVNDDFGLLTGCTNELMDKLSAMITSIKQESDHVSGSAEVLSDAANSSVAALTQMQSSLQKINSQGNEQYTVINNVSNDITGLKQGASELTDFMIAQSAAMQENSASITQMAANIASVAEMSTRADDLITGLAKISERGNSLVTSAINSISEIQTASNEVQQIVKVIQQISSQTNLLSMNAAIEAAHAGEFGAGFAVVANEVRSLAESSTKSAKEIQTHIKDMVEKINAGVDTSRQAGEAFKAIEDSVRENQKIMQALTTAMAEQSVGAEENMRVTNDVSAALEHASTLVQKQNEFAGHVRETMDSVVNITSEISECISEGLVATENMQSSINQVEQSVQTNKEAVTKMKEHVDSFEV